MGGRAGLYYNWVLYLRLLHGAWLTWFAHDGVVVLHENLLHLLPLFCRFGRSVLYLLVLTPTKKGTAMRTKRQRDNSLRLMLAKRVTSSS